MGPIGCTETCVRNYRYSLRDNTEGRSSCLFAEKPEIMHNICSTLTSHPSEFLQQVRAIDKENKRVRGKTVTKIALLSTT